MEKKEYTLYIINHDLKPKKQMRKTKKLRPSYLIVFLLLLVSVSSYGQNREEKTTAIIDRFHYINHQKRKYEIKLKPLLSRAQGNDSIKLVELQKLLTEEEISKRICKAFYEVFSDEEIDDIYNFMQKSAYKKLSRSGEIFKVVSTHFSDIDKEIDSITINQD